MVAMETKREILEKSSRQHHHRRQFDDKMERPPTASSSRPKTSSGRAPSARVRPPSASMNGGNGIQRPPSRLTMSRMSVSNESAGVPPPPSRGTTSFGAAGAAVQRMPTATHAAGRPMTGMARPPSSSMRPVTQQGLRAPSRIGTGSNRQVFDKTYFIGLLRAKINTLKVELARIREKKEDGEKKRKELSAYEARAQAQALDVRALHGKLYDLNVLIDRMHTNGDMSDIELEAAKIKEKADELENEAIDMMKARQQREEEVEKLQEEVEEQKNLNDTVAGVMDIEVREKFQNLKDESLMLRNQVLEMEKRVEELDDAISKYQIDIENNPIKTKAIQLKETLETLKKKESILLKEKNSQENPEEKKMKLAELMKKLNQDIAIIEKQYEQVKEEVNQASEELHEFDSQEDSNHVKHHAQYMELLAKDHQIEDLFQTYPKQMPLLQQELEEYSNAIVMNMRKISANIRKVKLDEKILDFDEEQLNLKSGNINELKELYVRLQEEIMNIDDMEMSLNFEIEELLNRNQEIDQELEEIEKDLNIDSDEYKRNLEEKKQHLLNEVPEAEREFTQLQNNLKNLKNEVESDPDYYKVKQLNEEITETQKRINKKEEELEVRKIETDYEPIKQEALKLQQEYNSMLVEFAAKRVF